MVCLVGLKNGNVEVPASGSWLLARMLYFDKQETPSREALDFVKCRDG